MWFKTQWHDLACCLPVRNEVGKPQRARRVTGVVSGPASVAPRRDAGSLRSWDDRVAGWGAGMASGIGAGLGHGMDAPIAAAILGMSPAAGVARMPGSICEGESDVHETDGLDERPASRRPAAARQQG
ncbi:hypothetical protein AQPW35_12070 [Rubrivivax pictus]|uniref:Uncharacterized protein n=1 Tax=Pseudaquabacterium pictum TaxID=2315236 RepID=A0A480AM92_9BURK|nr:hypothetical protein AQPW35_12070 [Rubrivivax pictus]